MASGDAILLRMARAKGHWHANRYCPVSLAQSQNLSHQNLDVDRELDDVAQEPSGYALPIGMGSQYGDGPHSFHTRGGEHGQKGHGITLGSESHPRQGPHI